MRGIFPSSFYIPLTIIFFYFNLIKFFEQIKKLLIVYNSARPFSF